MPEEIKYPPYFPKPKAGDVWQSNSLRGKLTACVLYVTERSDSDWEATIAGPSGRIDIEARIGHLSPESWVPVAWGWDADRRRWLPPAPPAAKSTSRRKTS